MRWCQSGSRYERSGHVTQLTGQPGQAGPEMPAAWDQQEIAGLTLAYGRRIELGGVLNLRDVGGYPAAGGGFVRWRTLLRSDALHKLDAAASPCCLGSACARSLTCARSWRPRQRRARWTGLPARLRAHLHPVRGHAVAPARAGGHLPVHDRRVRRRDRGRHQGALRRRTQYPLWSTAAPGRTGPASWSRWCLPCSGSRTR